MKGIISLLISLLVLMPSAYAASLPGDSAEGKRLYEANCMGCHDTSVSTSKDRVVQSDRRFEKAVGQLHPYGQQKILRERNAEPPELPGRSVLSFPLDVRLSAVGMTD